MYVMYILYGMYACCMYVMYILYCMYVCCMYVMYILYGMYAYYTIYNIHIVWYVCVTFRAFGPS